MSQDNKKQEEKKPDTAVEDKVAKQQKAAEDQQKKQQEQGEKVNKMVETFIKDFLKETDGLEGSSRKSILEDLQARVLSVQVVAQAPKLRATADDQSRIKDAGVFLTEPVGAGAVPNTNALSQLDSIQERSISK